MIGVCKLCHSRTDLLKRSHILPEFFYRTIYNADHSLNFYEVQSVFVDNPEPTQKKWKGEYESNILCKNCDNHVIGDLEDYFYKVIFGEEISYKIAPQCKNYGEEDHSYTRCKNLNYDTIKLFFLSLLWRCSISSRGLFNDIKLSIEEEETLRMFILNKKKADVSYLPMILQTWVYKTDMPYELLGQPRTLVRDGKPIGYHFLFPKLILMIFTDKSYIPTGLHDFIINEESISIIHLNKERFLYFLGKYIGIKK